MNPRCFQIRPEDNVATMIDDVASGPVQVIGAAAGEVTAGESISRGHKIALRDLPAGEPILKFGARIGHATQAIRRGAWVHLHNLASDLDERSGSLDLHSGVPTDTAGAYV
jgi:altronate dehydratase small subunit